MFTLITSHLLITVIRQKFDMMFLTNTSQKDSMNQYPSSTAVVKLLFIGRGGGGFLLLLGGGGGGGGAARLVDDDLTSSPPDFL